MPEFVEEDDDRKDEQEGNSVADDDVAYVIETMQKKLRHPVPLTQGQKAPPRPSRMPLRQFEAIGWRPYFARYGQRRWRHRQTQAAAGFRSASRHREWLQPAWRSRQT